MKPIEAGCNCGQCPFKRHGSEGEPGQFILATIPPRVRGIVITDAPTKREGDDLQTFAGHIGDRWREALEHARLDGDTLAVAHAVMCLPREPRRKEEMKAATVACSAQVQKLLALYPDVPVLTLGPQALAAVGVKGALAGRKSIRGFLNGRFLHTYSLTFASFADPYSWGPFLVDVARFSRMIEGTLETPPATVNQADAHQFFRLMNGTRSIAVDIETTPETPQEPWTGKDPTRALLKQIGFGDERLGLSIFWEDASETLRKMVKQLLADESVVKVFHNGPWFDLRVLARYGMPVTNWEDTRDMRRAVSSTSKLSLNHLGSLATDIHAWKGGDDKFDEDTVPEETEDAADVVDTKEVVSTNGPAWASDDKEEAGKYNALDCAITARVHRMCTADMLAEKKAGANVVKLYEVHKKLSLITAEMHTTGIHVNQDWRNFMLTCLEQSVVEKRELVRVAVGDEKFPVTANGMRSLIYARHAKTGIKCFHVPDPTDKRMWTNPELKETIAVNENSLLMLLVSGMAPDELVPVIEAWWTYQGELKRLGYVKSALLDHATGPDGRLRPGWNSCGTDTGRFACSQPNVMNIEQLLRVMFGPAPGNCMVHADKSQLELRVMAVVAGDPALQEALNTGDVYSYDARSWFKLAPDFDVKKKAPGQRKACKIIHLGAQYGAGDKTIWQQALRQDRRFTWNQVVALSKAFKKLYSRTVDYWDVEMERVQACSYSESRLLGRRRYYPSEPERSETVNYPVQSTAADMMNLEIIELHERLKKEAPRARIVFQLHDAVDVEAPEADAECVQNIITSVMDREWSFCGRTAAFPIEMKTAYSSKGETWQDL